MPQETPPTQRPAGPPPARIPRSCSDVYRLWAAAGLGLLVAIVLQILVLLVDEFQLRGPLTEAETALEEDYGSNLLAWIGFAVVYLWLGVRAFSGRDPRELARRILLSPLPAQRWKRWLLAGGGGVGWPIIIAIWAFTTVVTAVLNRQDVPPLTMVIAILSVLSCIAVISVSFAIHYARKDIAHRGLEFCGDDEPIFSDYIYFAVGNSVSLGTSDVMVLTSSMRRTVTVHAVMAWTLNTVVLATLVSLIIA